jgi:lipopolysaccharide biosynthesis regulator YciM
MRARMDLAQLLLSTGRTQDAIRHFEALLELNPNDNQGVRDILLGCYLSCDDLTGAQRLFRDYGEDTTAMFAWGRTLERFLSDDLPGAQPVTTSAIRRVRLLAKDFKCYTEEVHPRSWPQAGSALVT